MRFIYLLFLIAVVIRPASADISVVAIYEGQAKYLDAALGSPSPDLEALAQKYIVEPYLGPCSQGLSAQLKSQIEESLKRPIRDLDKLSDAISAFKSANLAGMVEDFARRAQDRLPNSGPLTYCVEVWDPEKMTRFQVFGENPQSFAAQFDPPSQIWMSVYPNSGWQDQIKYVVPHEYHHFARAGIEIRTLLEYMISEGLADAFVYELYGSWEPPLFRVTNWTEEEEREFWDEIQTSLGSTDPKVIARYLFGSVYGAEDLPPLPGYSIGRQIVFAFIEREPRVLVQERARLAAEDILDRSAYRFLEPTADDVPTPALPVN